MTLAQQIAQLTKKGFSQAQAETIALMREAAVALFRAFPESFVLYGGANLVFFHDSIRHSADLDLLSLTGVLPDPLQMQSVLRAGLAPLAQLLEIAPLDVRVLSADSALRKLAVLSRDARTLFAIDRTRMGAVVATGIELREIDSLTSGLTANVRSISADLLLLQKAEAFLLRRFVKVRDAYDIKLLLDAGTELKGGLKQQLETDLVWEEIDAEQILKRIEQVDARHCRSELTNILPKEQFEELESADFEPLRAALRLLFDDWL
jgi:hypothetical protein